MLAPEIRAPQGSEQNRGYSIMSGTSPRSWHHQGHWLALLMIGFIAVLVASIAAAAQSTDENTYDEATIVEKGSAYLGEGAEVMAKTLEGIFKKNGRPNAYIEGSEAGGGLIVGLRYGDGMLNHKIEGQRKVHWTGPSIGLDAGADAVKVFALVYGLYDTQEIYRRISAMEGSFYYVGGLGISMYGNKDFTIAMVRVGVGLRAQASLGYLNITEKRRWVPF